MTYGSQFDNKQAIMYSDLAQNEFFNLKKKIGVKEVNFLPHKLIFFIFSPNKNRKIVKQILFLDKLSSYFEIILFAFDS